MALTGSQAGTEISGNPHDEGSFPPFRTETYIDQLLWLAITFGFLLYAMTFYVIPRIRGIQENRKHTLDTDLEKASDLKNQAEGIRISYEERLQEAKKEAASLSQSIYEDVQKRLYDETQILHQKLHQRQDEAEREIAEARSNAMRDINAIASSAAEDIVFKLIGKNPSKETLKSVLQSLEGKM